MADLLRHHQCHGASDPFFIGQCRHEELLCGVACLTGKTKTPDNRNDLIQCIFTAEAVSDGGFCDNGHADGNRLTMRKAVMTPCLQRMTDCMAEIEYLTFPLIVFVTDDI